MARKRMDPEANDGANTPRMPRNSSAAGSRASSQPSSPSTATQARSRQVAWSRSSQPSHWRGPCFPPSAQGRGRYGSAIGTPHHRSASLRVSRARLRIHSSSSGPTVSHATIARKPAAAASPRLSVPIKLTVKNGSRARVAASAPSKTRPNRASPNSASPRPATASRPPSHDHSSDHGIEDCGTEDCGTEEEDGTGNCRDCWAGGCWAAGHEAGDCWAVGHGAGGCRAEDAGTEDCGEGNCAAGDCRAVGHGAGDCGAEGADGAGDCGAEGADGAGDCWAGDCWPGGCEGGTGGCWAGNCGAEEEAGIWDCQAHQSSGPPGVNPALIARLPCPVFPSVQSAGWPQVR